MLKRDKIASRPLAETGGTSTLKRTSGARQQPHTTHSCLSFSQSSSRELFSFLAKAVTTFDLKSRVKVTGIKV